METAYKCSACLLSYNEHQRRPLVLPCSHSYCQECLQQLATINNKLCPSCSDSWQHVEVADLLLCRQLLPAQPFSQSALDVSNICIRHIFPMLLWCETCHVSLCLKCLKLLHAKCQCRLIKDKTTELQKQCSNTLQKFKCTTQTIEENVNEITRDLNVMSILKEDLNKLETDTDSYRQQHDSWKSDMKQELSLVDGNDAASVVRDCSIPSLEKRVAKMKVPEKPVTLLTFIARAYAATKYKSKETTVSGFMESLEVVYKSAMTTPSSAVAGEKAGKQNPPELQDGQQWTLCGASSAVRAIATLTNSSARPSAVTAKRLVSWPTEVAEELFELLSRIECKLKMFMGDDLVNSFGNSGGADSPEYSGTVDSFSSVGTAKQVIQLYNKYFQEKQKPGMKLCVYKNVKGPNLLRVTTPSHRIGCTLVEVWGHLDIDTVNMLRATIERIGLVLASFGDEIAVCALGFLVNLDAVDLFVTKRFPATKWVVSGSSDAGNATDTVQRSLACVSLHFLDIDSTCLRWMMNVVEYIATLLRIFSYTLHLYLPGTTLSPDAVLGVVRDCRCISSVHLPPGLTLDHRKKELETQFKMHNCYIVWHTEYGLPLQVHTSAGVKCI